MHYTYRVRVEALLDLAGLERAHMGGVELAQLDAPEERLQVVPQRPLVALVATLAHLVASGVCEPGIEVVGNGELARVGEDDPLRLVRESLEPLVLRLLRRRA